MITIPTDQNLPFWTQTTALDGVDFDLEFRFNFREACYYMKISQPDGTVLAAGVKLVTNFRLLQAYADKNMPKGEMIAASLGPDDSNAGLGELGPGARVELVYFTREECTAAGKDLWRL